MKSADERLESLEKAVRTYRILVTVMVLLLVVVQRQRIVSWIDGIESWFGAVARAQS